MVLSHYPIVEILITSDSGRKEARKAEPSRSCRMNLLTNGRLKRGASSCTPPLDRIERWRRAANGPWATRPQASRLILRPSATRTQRNCRG